MGYWDQGEEGESFDMTSGMVWGDAPADIIDTAIDEVVKAFIRDLGRFPTKEELMAGFKFSWKMYEQGGL